jgi:hypothetical protein
MYAVLLLHVGMVSLLGRTCLHGGAAKDSEECGILFDDACQRSAGAMLLLRSCACPTIAAQGGKS